MRSISDEYILPYSSKVHNVRAASEGWQIIYGLCKIQVGLFLVVVWYMPRLVTSEPIVTTWLWSRRHISWCWVRFQIHTSGQYAHVNPRPTHLINVTLKSLQWHSIYNYNNRFLDETCLICHIKKTLCFAHVAQPPSHLKVPASVRHSRNGTALDSKLTHRLLWRSS